MLLRFLSNKEIIQTKDIKPLNSQYSPLFSKFWTRANLILIPHDSSSTGPSHCSPFPSPNKFLKAYQDQMWKEVRHRCEHKFFPPLQWLLGHAHPHPCLMHSSVRKIKGTWCWHCSGSRNWAEDAGNMFGMPIQVVWLKEWSWFACVTLWELILISSQNLNRGQ